MSSSRSNKKVVGLQSTARAKFDALRVARRDLADAYALLDTPAGNTAREELPNLEATYELAFEAYAEACGAMSRERWTEKS